MSAREELYAALMTGGPHSPDRSEKASMLLDAFAHELAEEIRARRDEHCGCCDGVRNDIADDIDPEVSSDG